MFRSHWSRVPSWHRVWVHCCRRPFLHSFVKNDVAFYLLYPLSPEVSEGRNLFIDFSMLSITVDILAKVFPKRAFIWLLFLLLFPRYRRPVEFFQALLLKSSSLAILGKHSLYSLLRLHKRLARSKNFPGK